LNYLTLNTKYKKIEKFINENNIILQKKSAIEQIKNIWLILFNEVLTQKQAYSSINYLKNKGFVFTFKKDFYALLKDYIINNKILFQKKKINFQIKKIWFILFNEHITLIQATCKIRYLKQKGFLFDIVEDSNIKFITYLLDNKIIFTHKKIQEKIKDIWFELFKEILTKDQIKSKISYLKENNFVFNFGKDYYSILIEYLIDNKILFQKHNMGQQIKDIWFKLFNEILTIDQTYPKIRQLNEKGFIFNFEKNSNTILMEYLINNYVVFKERNFYKELKEIWFKLFNEEISNSKCKVKVDSLKEKGFIFNSEKSSNTILKEFIINQKIIFQPDNINLQVQEIWLKLFNENLSLREINLKIYYLRKKGFVFHTEKDSYTILREYLISNKIVFQPNQINEQLQKIWFKIFNEKISLKESHLINNNFRKRGFFFSTGKDSYKILIDYLKNSNLWLEESEYGYECLQNIWEHLFQEKINLEKAKKTLIKVSLLYPQFVHRKIMPNFVDYKDLNSLTQTKYKEFTNIFALFCQNNNIFLSKNINEGQLSRIWSVCFASIK
jgi:hypothetical protein